MATIGSTESSLILGTHHLNSRLIVGTGKYSTYELMQESLEVSGADVITVAVRRERLIDSDGRNILDFIDSPQHCRLFLCRRCRPRRPHGS